MFCYRRLRDLREDADKTQREIGMLLQTTQQQYAKYEAGIQEIPTHHLLALADYYGVSVDYLVGRMDEETQELYSQIAKLSESEKSKLVKWLARQQPGKTLV